MYRMKLFYGYSIHFWVGGVLLIVFGNYFLKTLFGAIYKLTTGKDIGSSYYTTTKFGNHDYRYDFGKAIFRV